MKTGRPVKQENHESRIYRIYTDPQTHEFLATLSSDDRGRLIQQAIKKEVNNAVRRGTQG